MGSEKGRERRNEHLRLVYQERFTELKRIKAIYENLLVILTTAVAGGLFYLRVARIADGELRTLELE